MRKSFSVLFLLLLAACSQKYALDSYEAPQQKIPSGSALYVMVPENGKYGNITYAQSGEQTVQAIVAAFSGSAKKIETGKSPETFDSALAAARSKGATYIFQPLILNWEDRATEWSGIPDRITIKMVVYDVSSGKEIASSVARASSKWATFGGDHPQDLLPKVMDEFTKLFFQSA